MVEEFVCSSISSKVKDKYKPSCLSTLKISGAHLAHEAGRGHCIRSSG